MNWTSKEKSKFWNKAYQEYSLESGLSLKDLSNWIKINPFVAVAIEDRAIEFLKENQL
tara:strand:- start:1037 stop:1210 length:174 start_codon:yes stop_codon:yes gene_type:complete